MSPLVETTLFVFGLVGFGYLAGRTGYLRAEAGDSLSEFAVNVAVPLLLFRTMLGADFHGTAPWALWTTYFTAAFIAWTAGHLAVTRIFGRDGQAGVVGGVAAAFSNTVLLGVPFMLGVFGQQGFEILTLIVSIHLSVMTMASILLFAHFGRGRGGPETVGEMARDFVRKVGTNPLIIGIAAGLAWRFFGPPLPPLATRFIDALADVAGPVALFAMGLGLVKFGISGNVRPALVLSAIKLLLMPAVALGMAWALDLPPLAAKVAVVTAALPSGVNSYLIATQFGTGQGLASNAMTIGTTAAVLTCAFWLAVTQAVFG